MALKIFEGITRKVVPAFVALSFIGWIVFVAGFGKEYEGYALLQCCAVAKSFSSTDSVY
jgi:hypothetical protein